MGGGGRFSNLLSNTFVIFQFMKDRFQDLNDVDIDSAEFKCLPPEIQHEILSELKERRKRLTRHTNLVLPQVCQSYVLCTT